MLLSEESILQHIKSGDIEITPFDPSLLKGASYTLTLDSKMRRLKPVPFVDTRTDRPEFEEFEIGSEGFLLQPGEFVVGLTREKIKLNEKFGCLLSARGSRAQAGLDILQSSTFCEPDSDNQMALEITNHGPYPVKLYAGIKIVKGVFAPID